MREPYFPYLQVYGTCVSVRKTSISCIYCSEFMKSLAIKDPQELRRKMELFTAEQRTLNKKRLDLLESLRFVEVAVALFAAVFLS